MTIHCTNIKFDVSDDYLDFMDDCHEAMVFPTEWDIDIDEEDWNAEMENFDDDRHCIEHLLFEDLSFQPDDFEYEIA